MKLKLIASLVAASFLAGCSSSGSSDNNGPTPQDGIADVQYFEGENAQAALIKGDEGTYQAAMIKGQETDTLIRINGQTFTTDGDSVKDANGVTVGHIQKEGDSIIFHGNHGAEVSLSVVNGRLIVTDVQHPIDPDYGITPTPDHPIELDPEYGIGVAPTYGDILEVGGAIIIKGDGENQAIVRMDGQGNAIVFINDYNNGFVISNSEIHDTDGNLVGHASKEGDDYIVRLEDGTEVVFRNDNGRLFAAVIARPDIDNPIERPAPEHPIEIDPDYDAGVVPTYGDILAVGGAVIVQGDNNNQAIVRMDDQGNAIVFINDYDNGFVISNSEIHDTDGNLVGHASKEGDDYIVRLEDGTEVVFRNDNGRLFAAVIARPDIDNPIERPAPEADNGRSVDKIADNAWVVTTHGEIDGYITIENGTVYLRDSDRNEIKSWKPQLPKDLNEIKKKARSLSQEQRQQIKQAIKDRAPRS
ncbi:hypothetical protein [Aliivibrio fischeri]|uniref:hypothetical protein n=1 Tax=Aliivibrio fischeri TaxID=668 RepID=UPI003734C879